MPRARGWRTEGDPSCYYFCCYSAIFPQTGCCFCHHWCMGSLHSSGGYCCSRHTGSLYRLFLLPPQTRFPRAQHHSEPPLNQCSDWCPTHPPLLYATEPLYTSQEQSYYITTSEGVTGTFYCDWIVVGLNPVLVPAAFEEAYATSNLLCSLRTPASSLFNPLCTHTDIKCSQASRSHWEAKWEFFS